jgi:hypothetical protein
MTDKPKIEVGQRWVTRGDYIVRVLAVDGWTPDFPVITEDELGRISLLTALGFGKQSSTQTDHDLLFLAPSTVKREVALYRAINTEDTLVSNPGGVFVGEVAIHSGPANYLRISEQQSIEFTLLPGESA